MTIYQRAKYKVSGYMERVTGVSALDHCNTMGARPNIHTMTCFGTAGMFTGFCVSFVACQSFKTSKRKGSVLTWALYRSF